MSGTVVKYRVAVHKSLPLNMGETVREFTQKLRGTGEPYVTQQLNIAKDQGGAYLTEVMSNVAVFEVWKRDKPGYQFFAVKFARGKTGNFELSSLTEVERVTSFRAKATSATVQKSLVAESTGDEAWCRKSLFAGIL